MLSLQVVFPPPPIPHIFPLPFQFQSQFQSHSHSPFSLLARCLPRFPLALELDVPVGSISRSPRVYSLQSSRRIQSTVCILHCALAVQSTKCISASSMHLLCLPVSLPLSLCLSLPDRAFDRAHTISFFQCSLPCVRCNVCFCLFESQLKLFCTISARSSNLIGVWPLQL